MIINNNNSDDSNNICTGIINSFSDIPLNNDDVISMVEMALSILFFKKDMDIELSSEEKEILNSINLIKDNKEKLINYYNTNRDKIIKVFINNFFDVQKEDIFIFLRIHQMLYYCLLLYLVNLKLILLLKKGCLIDNIFEQLMLLPFRHTRHQISY